MEEIKLIADKDYPIIPYTKEYGVAEFTCCPIYKYGKLKKIYLYPRQQPDKRGIFY